MKDRERINQLREMVEYASVIIGDCKEFIHVQFSGTPGRERLLRENYGYENFLTVNF